MISTEVSAEIMKRILSRFVVTRQSGIPNAKQSLWCGFYFGVCRRDKGKLVGSDSHLRGDCHFYNSFIPKAHLLPSWKYNQPMSILSGKRILLGVTDSIAAYKSTDLASKLTQATCQWV